MTALQLGSGPVFLVGGLLLVVAAVTVSQAFEVVNAYEKRALTVFDEYRTTLEPGINVGPPFVSSTTSIDMRSQRATLSVETTTADRASARVEAVVDVAVTDAERASSRPTTTGAIPWSAPTRACGARWARSTATRSARTRRTSPTGSGGRRSAGPPGGVSRSRASNSPR